MSRLSGMFSAAIPQERDGNGKGMHGKRASLFVRLGIIVVVALVAEVFLFNATYWGTRGNEPLTLLNTETTIDSADDTLTFEDLDIAATNITITFTAEQGSAPIYAEYAVTDAGMAQYYDMPAVQMLASNERSCTQNLHTYGNLTGLKIAFANGTGYNEDTGVALQANSYPVHIACIQLNTCVPFEFNVRRFSLLLAIMLLLYAFRPRSVLYRVSARDKGRLARGAWAAAVAATIVLVFIGIFVHTDWVQLSTSWYNADKWDGSAAVTYVQPAWYDEVGNNEYIELAHSMAQGKLSLPEEAPAWLAQVEDPYNPGIQNQMAAATGQSAKVDAAYYGGAYYVYFGVVPELALYLPFYLVTGCDLPNACALLVPMALFGVGLYLLIISLIRRRFPRVSLGVALLVFFGVFACSAIEFGVGRPTLYQVPFACARCLVVWSLFLFLEGWHRASAPQIAGGALCMALVAGCRPQFLLFGVAAIALFVALVRPSARHAAQGRDERARTRMLVALIVPFVVVAAGLAWYNAARFGSPFDFGASRNLAGNDMSLRGNVPARLVDGLFLYLLQPAHASTVFPFLLPADASTTYAGMTIIEPMAGGVLATQPFLWAILLCGDLRRSRPRVFGTIVFLAAAAVVVCCFDIQASGILGRYYQDICLYLALAAGLAVFAHFDRPTEGVPIASAPSAQTDARPAIAHVPSLRLKLLYIALVATMFYFLLVFFLTFDNAACNTMAGSDAGTWEYLRQTFSWWI